jgi:hypothetical protein
MVKNKNKKNRYRKKRISKSLRQAVWNRHIGDKIGKTKCLCCNVNEISQMTFECGHITAESKGGLTNIDNLMPICGLCNKSMGTINLFEFKKNFLSNSKIKEIIYIVD